MNESMNGVWNNNKREKNEDKEMYKDQFEKE